GPARQEAVTRFLSGKRRPHSLVRGKHVSRPPRGAGDFRKVANCCAISDETQHSPPRRLSRRNARGVVYAALAPRGTPGMALKLRLSGQDRAMTRAIAAY